jgi:hypothetical protein
MARLMPIPGKGCDPVFPICQCGREMSTLVTYHEPTSKPPYHVVRTFALCPVRAGRSGHDSQEITR